MSIFPPLFCGTGGDHLFPFFFSFSFASVIIIVIIFPLSIMLTLLSLSPLSSRSTAVVVYLDKRRNEERGKEERGGAKNKRRIWAKTNVASTQDFGALEESASKSVLGRKEGMSQARKSLKGKERERRFIFPEKALLLLTFRQYARKEG